MESEKIAKNEYRNFKQIANVFYNEELEILDDEETVKIKNAGTISIVPKIIFDKFTGDLKVEFRVGNKKFYKIKELSSFYDKMMNNEFYRYGEKLQFIHNKEVFTEDSKNILKFIMKYAEIIKMANSTANNNYRYYGKVLDESVIIVGNSGIDDLFEFLKGQNVDFQTVDKTEKIYINDDNPKIEFTFTKTQKNEYIITPNIEVFSITIIKGSKYKYILSNGNLYRCSKEFEKTNLRLLEMFRQNYISELRLGKEELNQLFSIVIPKVKDAIIIKGIEKEELEKYKPQELITKVYLDIDKRGYVIADIKFNYGENEFNPLDESIKIEFPRNIIKETKALNIFKNTGFMFDSKNSRFILPTDDKIYQFLSQDIEIYTQNFQVLITDGFKNKQIKQTQIGNIGIKIENNLLEVNLGDLNIDTDEIESIIEKYRLKKQFYRLKSGEFLSLEENTQIDFLEKLVSGMNVSYRELEEGKITVPIYRTLYLDQLLKRVKGTTGITKSSEFNKIVNNLEKEGFEEEINLPDTLNKVLRSYQKTGFRWLKVLDKYKFGGILADDMGLGKTIQMLSIIVDYINSDNNSNENIIEGQEKLTKDSFGNYQTVKNDKRASLVISPSFLTLNWRNEANKFETKLKTLIIRGDAKQRASQISKIDDYDLVITSYDLLKRDLNEYIKLDYNFKYIIADEAQYLKNSSTQNAKSIKELKSDTRYALTGTPIENSLSELWSIFDFVMPGYLFEYKKFKNEYEIAIVKNDDVKAIEKLKMLISPFILRRTKKEVLPELPEKTITVLNNEMGEEQLNIYLSYLAQAKREVAEEMNIDGAKNNQMKILAALTRLRQICCHPGLFIDNYNDGSSKLEQCMEIVKDAIDSGHKILLFSSYTSMFGYIEKELKNLDIRYSKIIGETKVDNRIGLVDEFNENDDIKVFLISLKAGGTGLNLTGADVVIHFDPWWNLSAENQATDRAYRIGQKNSVQVYKLITKNTIEEKIYELQQRKEELIDNMLSTETVFVNKLSREDILSLFE